MSTVPSVTFERTGELLAYGGDIAGRPDTVEFIARAGEPTIDWLGEAFVTVDRWGTREGIATVFESDGAGAWTPAASSLPFDAMYVTRQIEIRLVFGSYVRLQPGKRYRVLLAGAVVASPLIRIAALVKQPEPVSTRRGFRRVRKAS